MWDKKFQAWQTNGFPLDPSSDTPKPGEHPNPTCSWNEDEYRYLKEQGHDADKIMNPHEKTSIEDY